MHRPVYLAIRRWGTCFLRCLPTLAVTHSTRSLSGAKHFFSKQLVKLKFLPTARNAGPLKSTFICPAAQLCPAQSSNAPLLCFSYTRRCTVTELSATCITPAALSNMLTPRCPSTGSTALSLCIWRQEELVKQVFLAEAMTVNFRL